MYKLIFILKVALHFYKPDLELDEEKLFHGKGLSKEKTLLLVTHDHGQRLHCQMYKTNCQKTLMHLLFLSTLGKRSTI